MTYNPVIKWEKFIHIQDELQDQVLSKLKSHEDSEELMNITIAPEHNTYANQFNSWIIHVPYRLSNQLCQIISKVEGVESFQRKTDYRGVVTFGKAFYDDLEEHASNQVGHLKSSVESAILKYVNTKELYYAQVILPNNSVILKSGNSKSAISEEIEDLKYLAENVSGVFETNVKDCK